MMGRSTCAYNVLFVNQNLTNVLSNVGRVRLAVDMNIHGYIHGYCQVRRMFITVRLSLFLFLCVCD